MSTSMLLMNIGDLSAAAMPTAPSSYSSPSKNPCMVRVAGGLASRYRNDPYNGSVLPPLGHAPAAPTMVDPQSYRLAPLPPAFAMTRKTSGLKAKITRAQEFATTEADAIDLTTDRQSLTISPPAAPQAEVGWAFVRLKHEVLLYNLRFPVAVGDAVVMEGDRGENIGRVDRLVEARPQHPVQCSVLRFVTNEDIVALRAQREREEAAKHFTQGVADALGMTIQIVDTEFQADGNKLTVYFLSRRQIDFRRLQRQLFKQYRCRIWLVNWADVSK